MHSYGISKGLPGKIIPEALFVSRCSYKTVDLSDFWL